MRHRNPRSRACAWPWRNWSAVGACAAGGQAVGWACAAQASGNDTIATARRRNHRRIGNMLMTPGNLIAAILPAPSWTSKPFAPAPHKRGGSPCCAAAPSHGYKRCSNAPAPVLARSRRGRFSITPAPPRVLQRCFLQRDSRSRKPQAAFFALTALLAAGLAADLAGAFAAVLAGAFAGALAGAFAATFAGALAATFTAFLAGAFAATAAVSSSSSCAGLAAAADAFFAGTLAARGSNSKLTLPAFLS